MEIRGGWYEVRSTALGVLEHAPQFVDQPPPGERFYEGLFSLVINDAGRKTRRLPAFFLGGALLYTHRDVGSLIPRVERTVEAMRAAGDMGTYFINACDLDGQQGLYARDINASSAFRRRLMRAGLIFSSDPFVTFEQGVFACDDWGELSPAFIILGFGDEDDPRRVVRPTSGESLFSVAASRFEPPPPEELRLLAGRLRTMDVSSADDAVALVSYLGSTG